MIRNLQINTDIRFADFLTGRWALIALGLAVGGAVGLYEVFVGHILATTQVVVWTTPLITYFFLALGSAGLSMVLSYGFLSEDSLIRKHVRYLLVLDLALLLGGFTALATELGSVLNMVYIMITPNPTSPIWWMGNFYSVKLLLVAIKLLREILGIHGRLDRLISWLTMVIAAAAALTIGVAMGTAIGRPDYAGTFTSILTLSMALMMAFAWVVMLRRDAKLAERFNVLARQMAGIVTVLLVLEIIYDTWATTLGLIGWVNPLMPLLFAVIALAGGVAPRIMAAVALASSFWVLFSFTITGQLWVLGANTSFFGQYVSFTPNLAEIGTIVLGLAVAAAVYNMGRLLLLEGKAVANTA